jgi:hypothetical protein
MDYTAKVLAFLKKVLDSILKFCDFIEKHTPHFKRQAPERFYRNVSNGEAGSSYELERYNRERKAELNIMYRTFKEKADEKKALEQENK